MKNSFESADGDEEKRDHWYPGDLIAVPYEPDCFYYVMLLLCVVNVQQQSQIVIWSGSNDEPELAVNVLLVGIKEEEVRLA